MDLGRWLVILWLITSKYNGWVLIGGWAAIRTNMVSAIRTNMVSSFSSISFTITKHCAAGSVNTDF